MSAQSHQRRPKTNDSKRLLPAASRRLGLPKSRRTVPTQCQRRCPLHATAATTTPATSREDNSRDISHDALCAGNIGTQGKTNPPATHSVESHSPTTPV